MTIARAPEMCPGTSTGSSGQSAVVRISRNPDSNNGCILRRRPSESSLPVKACTLYGAPLRPPGTASIGILRPGCSRAMFDVCGIPFLPHPSTAPWFVVTKRCSEYVATEKRRAGRQNIPVTAALSPVFPPANVRIMDSTNAAWAESCECETRSCSTLSPTV